MKPSPYGPFSYSPIIRRPPLAWPDAARVALWVIPNIEFFSLEERPGGSGSGKIPDIPLWSARDYGNRVGVFRLMQVLDRHGIRATVALNSDVCGRHPVIIEEGAVFQGSSKMEPKTANNGAASHDTESGNGNKPFSAPGGYNGNSVAL